MSEEVTGSKLGGSWVANVMKPCLPFPSHLLPLSWRSVSLMFSCCFPLNDLFLYGNVVMGYAGLEVGGEGVCHVLGSLYSVASLSLAAVPPLHDLPLRCDGAAVGE